MLVSYSILLSSLQVDMDEEWVIPSAMSESKSRWTPFVGKKVKGKVHRVIIRSQVAFANGRVVSEPGFGLNVREMEGGTALKSKGSGLFLDNREERSPLRVKPHSSSGKHFGKPSCHSWLATTLYGRE